MDSLVNWFVNSPLGHHISRQLLVFIISLFPILELRGGLLASTLLKLPLWQGVLLSAAGNFVPIPFILLFIKRIFAWLRKTRLFKPLVDRLESSAMRRRQNIEKYGFWGLMLFVGIPLPVTGAWTGSLVAALLDMDFKTAIKAEICGIIMASVIMTIISYGIIGHIIR
ncbi:MAG: small multi-drug export protein [Lachnospiraceae bacterium]|nr:small multi-drug export protein [Lachnospiraceae bacterium]